MNERLVKALEEKREYEQRLTEYTLALHKRSNKEKIAELAQIRNMPVEVLEEQGVFYIGAMTEMMLPKYIDSLQEFGVISPTNNKPIFNNRWVFPIKTPDGLVQNLVGYSPYSDERYIYGTARYYRRRNTLYGLENLKLAYELGFAVLTEGITDAVRLRSLGIKNSFGNCGTFTSEIALKQLNRCEYGVIKIPDRDKAGIEAEKKWKVLKGITLIVPMQYKDCDEMLRDADNVEYFLESFKEVTEILKEQKHEGRIHENKVFTLL